MGKYADMAARGRAAAHETNRQRQVTIARYGWREEPTRYGHWVEACPPFTTERQWRVDTNGTHWEIDVFGDCGHRLTFAAYGVLREGYVPPRLEMSWPIGRKKRCPTCPPPEPKPAPPDAERCSYTWDTEFDADVRCRTRARWEVFHEAPDGERSEATWPRVCEKHRRKLVELGYIMPELLPHPYGYTDGARDALVEIPRVRSGPGR